MGKQKQSKNIFDDKVAPQLMRHHWKAAEMSNLGKLLTDLGTTLSSAAGRLQRHDQVHHKLAGGNVQEKVKARGIHMRSPSTLNDAMETLCSHSWHMRNKVNKKIGLNQTGSSDEVAALEHEIIVLTEAKSRVSDPEIVRSLTESINSLLRRVANSREGLETVDEIDYFEDMEPPVEPCLTSLDESDPIDVLMDTYGDDFHTFLFGGVGKDQLENAINRLKEAGVEQIYQLLNMTEEEVLGIVGGKEQATWRLHEWMVLGEVLHLYGFKWRTDGNTRFDLPVGQFGFSQTAYRTRSERHAATLLLRDNTGSLNFREDLIYIFEHANDVASKTDKHGNLTCEVEVVRWFEMVSKILNNFKGIIPERLWYMEIKHVMPDPQSRLGESEDLQNAFSPRLTNAIESVIEHESVLRADGPCSVSSTFNNNDLSYNYYLTRSPYTMPLADDDPDLLHSPMTPRILVQAITQILFEWVKSVEFNAMMVTAVPEPEEDGDDRDFPFLTEEQWVWHVKMADRGLLPLCWHTKDLDPNKGGVFFQFVEPIELGEKLEYKREKHT